MGLLLLVERALLLELAALARRAALDLGQHGLLFGQVELGGRDGPRPPVALRDVLPDVHGAALYLELGCQCWSVWCGGGVPLPKIYTDRF